MSPLNVTRLLLWLFVAALIAIVPAYRTGDIPVEDAMVIAVICNVFIVLIIRWFKLEGVNPEDQEYDPFERQIFFPELSKQKPTDRLWLTIIPWLVGGLTWLLLFVSKPLRGLPLSYNIKPETAYILASIIPISVVIALIYWIMLEKIIREPAPPKHG